MTIGTENFLETMLTLYVTSQIGSPLELLSAAWHVALERPLGLMHLVHVPRPAELSIEKSITGGTVERTPFTHGLVLTQAKVAVFLGHRPVNGL